MNDSLSLPSFAKINWSLRVLGKRPDNYHEVHTSLQTISLHDQLTFELSSDQRIELSCNEPGIPTDDRNLVVRAALALRAKYSIKHGVRIHLEKKLPVEAGLGGGSSNAAVSLMALAHLWRIPVEAGDLLEIGTRLGADVPFFLFGGSVLATGTGTTLTPQTDPGVIHLIVIALQVSVSTRVAYSSLEAPALTTESAEFILSSSQKSGVSVDSSHGLPSDLVNDFEPVIFDIYPEIRRAKEALIAAGADGALLTGSGSSVFGIFADSDSQHLALDKIKCEAGWRIFPCVTVSRNEYQQAIGSELFVHTLF